MNIKKDRLYVIGRLIGIYREQRRGKSQNSFTQKSFAKDICSVNTLKRIESGETARDEYVYQSLLAKFNLKLGYYEDVDNYIESLMDSLYDAIEYYRLEDILTICGKALRVLNEVKEYIYYNELYVLFKSTYQYYKEDIEVDDDTMEHFYKIYSFMNKEYNSLYKRMIFTRAQIYAINNIQYYYNLINELNFTSSEKWSEKIPVLHYYYISKQYLKMKKLIEVLEQHFIKVHNYTRLIDIYTCNLLLHSNIEKEKVKDCILKAEQIINNYNVPNIKKREFYSNVAIAFYSMKDYNKALEFFDRVVNGENYQDNIYLPFLIYMAYCQKVLGKEIELPKMNDKNLKKYSKDLQLMYNYFVFKDIPLFAKQNIILKEIAPFLTDKEFINIFRYEMKGLVEVSLNYKNLLLYDKIIEQNLAKIDNFNFK